ncbi:MAG: anaerobic ribonucleoside-triphosphate reductase activating protein [Oscillospiraceae bacterium]|nr:anaerobic ribonucleoside-triphosphate reductase activating protein [Oscillospiraceae bacterium]
MLLAGLQKLTLLDFPGRVACTVFTAGCNLRCPFCHNSDLVLPERKPPLLDTESFFSFLKKRQGVLEGVCVTGGEPLLQKDIASFLHRIKDLGFAVKLDTNGCFPRILRSLVEDGLVDFVAMDIKNSPARYAQTAGIPNLDLSAVEESIRFLMSGAVDYEFRTTVAAQLHDEDSMEDIARWIAGAKRYAIQNFRDSGDILSSGLSPCTQEQIGRFVQIVSPHIQQVVARGDIET